MLYYNASTRISRESIQPLRNASTWSSQREQKFGNGNLLYSSNRSIVLWIHLLDLLEYHGHSLSDDPVETDYRSDNEVGEIREMIQLRYFTTEAQILFRNEVARNRPDPKPIYSNLFQPSDNLRAVSLPKDKHSPTRIQSANSEPRNFLAQLSASGSPGEEQEGRRSGWPRRRPSPQSRFQRGNRI